MSQRNLLVTNEALSIPPHLLGKPLASPRRRGAALMLDLVLAAIIGLPLYGVFLYLVIDYQAPGLASRTHRVLTQQDLPDRGELFQEIQIDMVLLLYKRKPGLLSLKVREACQAQDRVLLAELLGNFNWKFDMGRSYSSFDSGNKSMLIARDVIFGRFSSYVGLFSIVIVYFTLLTWLMKGKTPGKWVLGIRVIRLDGKSISLWDSFGRCGGYTSSLSTLGLGFLEAAWHPNRQTTHDRISGTVVIREPKL